MANIFFVPQFRFNLFSISLLIESHKYSINFLVDSCLIQDHTQGMMIGKSTKQGNLDVLDSTNFSYFHFNILAN